MLKIFLIAVALLCAKDTAAESKSSHSKAATLNATALSVQEIPTNCKEATAASGRSGIYLIQAVPYLIEPIYVFCDAETLGGGWTVIQRRISADVDFYRDWSNYKNGFGSLNENFWLGLDKIHALTTNSPQELMIILDDFDFNRRWALYNLFAIGSEQQDYAMLELGAYSGDAGDSLRNHVSMKFTTKDRKNNSGWSNCAVNSQGGWWYNQCLYSNLNGRYLHGPLTEEEYQQGIVWQAFRGWAYSLRYATMMVRPK